MKAFIFTCSVLLCTSSFMQAEELYSFDDPRKEKRFYSLISEIRCPKCTSGSIASSDVPVSRDLKQRVYELIQSGSSNAEIKNYVKQRFGASSDYKPAFEGANYILWLGPFIFLGLMITLFFLRRRL
ncbi:cytochrome c-type biogenesis protein CcmH [Gammaproteobacteria bacterium]|nr:cytochrome c-type biogenesis protein CcmH [Gammaproteobacteria bacterium]MDA8924489.1 cytochrome c-type biogenesis protein CcmH [Gammaproteobacteria bacterium]MDA9154086.1 cytochrome c-type biogenesis protein CcmH [Gammaproteobacteria bacterium]MDA9371283.1 cytochrome c-type biogenesis protein CcmH [Gammaproteobacteria bacterium]MDC0014567.1 cytochrome c-type biogenesis protein CcmH [Gammaproteobacteria bacterium]